MKRIMSFLLVMTVLLSAVITVSAEDFTVFSEEVSLEKDAVGAIVDNIPETTPMWKYLQNVSLTFFVMAGRADVSYTVSSSKADIKVTVTIYKNGFISEKITEKEFSTADKKFINGSITVPVTEDGTYTATIVVRSGSDKTTIKKKYSYCAADYIGDVNYDGQIRADDARRVLRYAAKIDRLSDAMKKVCDVDCNDYVNAADARIVLRRAARL